MIENAYEVVLGRADQGLDSFELQPTNHFYPLHSLGITDAVSPDAISPDVILLHSYFAATLQLHCRHFSKFVSGDLSDPVRFLPFTPCVDHLVIGEDISWTMHIII